MTPTPRQIVAGTKVLEPLIQRMLEGPFPRPVPEEIVSRIHTAMEMAGWEPIESAPEHLDVLVSDGRSVAVGQLWGRWVCGSGGERWFTDERGEPYDLDFIPSHWRPLPPPAIEKE